MSHRHALATLLWALRHRLCPPGSSVTVTGEGAPAEGVFEAAAANKILSLVAGPLRNRLSSDQISAVRRYQELCLSRNNTILHDSLAITRHLRALSIPHVFIKGPIQQAALYSDFFVRPSLDIDILVSGGDYQRTVDALAILDYSVASKSLWWRTFLGEQHLAKPARMAPTIDLHYRLQQPGAPAPRSTSGYIGEAVHCAFLDDHLPRLADADIPLLSAISIVKALYHREPAGSHVVDLFVSLKAGAPEMVNSFLARAEHQGIAGSAMLALRIAGEAFGVGFASTGLETVLPSVTSADLVRMAFTPDDPDLVWPKRRTVLWELCRRRPVHFAVEAARAIASEATLRIVERPAMQAAVAD